VRAHAGDAAVDEHEDPRRVSHRPETMGDDDRDASRQQSIERADDLRLRNGVEARRGLIYGTRRPNDMCWYPRSNKIAWRGLGVIGRIEALEYDDGEPED
jgi:hypothetical protein